MKIAIRTDSSHLIGTGHVVRCLTLAEALRAKGATVSFICRELSGMIVNQIIDKGFPVEMLCANLTTAGFDNPENTAPHGHWLPVSELQDANDTLEVLKKISAVDLVIVDHYALTAVWEGILKSKLSVKIFVIDDLADRKHDCDYLHDACDVSGKPRYETLLPKTCVTMIGPSFGLLREQFTLMHSQGYRDRTKIKSMMIFSGGRSYPEFLSLLVTCLNEDAFREIQKNFVIPDFDRHDDFLKQSILSIPNISLHRQVASMAEFMNEQDLYLGSGGTVSWERFCVGLPGVVVAVADNQYQISKNLADQGFQFFLGHIDSLQTEDLISSLQTLIKHPEKINACAIKALELVDGNGVERVCDVLLKDFILLRKALPVDSVQMHLWRNHPEVRKHALDAREITFEEHSDWFDRVLSDSSRQLLLALNLNQAIGVLRFDCQGTEAEVSIYLDPAQLHRGLGLKVLLAGERWLIKHLPQIKTIRAVIKTENAASIRCFEKAGYRFRNDAYYREVTCDEN